MIFKHHGDSRKKILLAEKKENYKTEGFDWHGPLSGKAAVSSIVSETF